MSNSQEFAGAVEEYLSTSLESHIRNIASVGKDGWYSRLAEHAERTPAYRAFLAERGLTPRSVAAGATLPATTKANYILNYPLESRCLDGRLNGADIMAVSSGSTGKAMLWPRSLADELRTGYLFEQIFKNSFCAHELRTLVVNCLPLGIWIGGLHTVSSIRLLAAKGFPVAAAAPGLNTADIGRCLEEIAPLYDQTVICGYPPFVRDVVDQMVPSRLDPQQVRVKLLLAGEAISESWRDDMASRLQMTDIHADCISMYGTADAGAIAFETAAAIRLRRAMSPALVNTLFSTALLPCLFQYLPDRVWIDEHTENVAISSLSTHPLFRYELGDAGYAISAESLGSRIAGASIGCAVDSPLPYVAQFGRSDSTVKFFGGKVYAEHVASMLDSAAYRRCFSGRFTMIVKHSEAGNRPLTIVVEKSDRPEGAPIAPEALAEALEAHLIAVSTEYANYVPKPYQRPDIELVEHGEPAYFGRKGKQRYVIEEPGT